MTPIYHITHVANLPSIVQDGCLWSDAQRIEQGIENTNIGHSHIKQRRLRRSVTTAAKGYLGDYVPFNFCNRSVMLYAISKNNVQNYDGGQALIVHLVSSAEMAVNCGQPWTFTDRHADVAHARYFEDLDDLSEVDWDAMTRRYWTEVMEVRQAEFLVHERFPWTCVNQIVVLNESTARRAQAAIARAKHKPSVAID